MNWKISCYDDIVGKNKLLTVPRGLNIHGDGEHSKVGIQKSFPSEVIR